MQLSSWRAADRASGPGFETRACRPGLGIINQCVPFQYVVGRVYLNVPVAHGHVWVGLYNATDTAFSSTLASGVFSVDKTSWADVTFAGVRYSGASAYVLHAIDNDIYHPNSPQTNPIANSPAIPVCFFGE